MRILGVAGRNGSGKDEVVNFLHARCSVAAVSPGDVVRDIAAREKISPTRENLHVVSQRYMEKEGSDFVARRLIRLIETRAWEAVGVSGVRSPDDVAAFRSRFGAGFQLAYVRVGDPTLRFRRLRERREERDPYSLEEFLEQERDEEAQFGIGRVINEADVIIPNDAGLSALHRHIERSSIWHWLCNARGTGA